MKSDWWRYSHRRRAASTATRLLLITMVCYRVKTSEIRSSAYKLYRREHTAFRSSTFVFLRATSVTWGGVVAFRLRDPSLWVASKSVSDAFRAIIRFEVRIEDATESDRAGVVAPESTSVGVVPRVMRSSSSSDSESEITMYSRLRFFVIRAGILEDVWRVRRVREGQDTSARRGRGGGGRS